MAENVIFLKEKTSFVEYWIKSLGENYIFEGFDHYDRFLDDS